MVEKALPIVQHLANWKPMPNARLQVVPTSIVEPSTHIIIHAPYISLSADSLFIV
jgi:hypothetical protein